MLILHRWGCCAARVVGRKRRNDAVDKAGTNRCSLNTAISEECENKTFSNTMFRKV